MIRTQTFIDDWLEEAEEKGHKEGHKEGLRKGIHDAKYEALIQFLNYKFVTVPTELLQQLQNLSADELSVLFNQALTAQNLAEIEMATTKLVKAATEVTDTTPAL